MTDTRPFTEIWRSLDSVSKVSLYIEVAKTCPISSSTLSNAGKGRHKPVLTTRISICNAIKKVLNIESNIKLLFPND